MRKVYMSFLGTGEYKKTIYSLDEELARETRFVQVAEFELLGSSRPDTAYILVTEESQKKNFSALQGELQKFDIVPEAIILAEDMSSQGQWIWLEQILKLVKKRDHLTLDLTHGYRSLPIIFSTALNFLQKTQQVVIEHVFYGAYEMNHEQPPIIDMKKFYDINIWADAVTRLTEDADAGGIAKAAVATNRYQFSELAGDKFAAACSSVTERIKNVDVNNVADGAHNLLQQIEKMKKNASPGASILLDLVRDKFTPLTNPCTSNPDKTCYTLDYFHVQLRLARLLIEHGLFMQAFTVMKEWLSSLVMLYFEAQGTMNAGKRRKRCEWYGGVFFNMLQFKEEKWNFKGKEKERDRILPFYHDLKKNGVLDLLIKQKPTVAKRLSDYRNGFDHAWLGKAGMEDDIEQQGGKLLEILEDSLQRLQQLR